MTLQVNIRARFGAPRVVSLFLTAAAIAGFYPSIGAAAERFYRDNLSVITGPPSKYVIEVPEAAAMHGGYFKVTTDDKGRVTRVIFLQDGKPTSDTVYEYDGNDASRPAATKVYRQGALTSTSKIARDTSGRPTRSDFFTAQGVPTGHTITNYVDGHTETANYTPDGQRRWYGETYFNDDGIAIKSVTHLENNSSSQERTYDPNRGVEKSSKQFVDGKLRVSRVSTYNDDDDVIRQDLYDETGTWYGARLYEQNLLVKKMYKFKDGHTAESVIQYDANRWKQRAQFSRDNKAVCSFVYEHLPDGTIKRTIALGPDGSLWAEYPNIEVVEVDQTGHSPNSMVGIIHKKGIWW